MKIAKEDFEKRKAEIEKYFDFLSLLDKDNLSIHFSEKGVDKESMVSDELLRILIANGFLLIYNLVEAVIRITLVEYLSSISKSAILFSSLHEDIQRLWIANKRFADKNIESKSEEVIFQELYNEIVSNTIVSFTTELKNDKGEIVKEFVKLSGNVDAASIRKLAIKYGFDSKVGPAEKAGADLENIKRKRNHLAHGRITFADCGKEYSVKQMCDYKNNAIGYLESILANIEKHIKDGKFKVPKKKKK